MLNNYRLPKQERLIFVNHRRVNSANFVISIAAGIIIAVVLVYNF